MAKRFETRAAVATLFGAAALALFGACRGGSTAPEGDAGVEARRHEREFTMRCASCHEAGRAVHGPSLEEVASLHAADPEGIVRWARAPGRKRDQYQPMPSFRHLSEQDLRGIATHMIAAGRR